MQSRSVLLLAVPAALAALWLPAPAAAARFQPLPQHEQAAVVEGKADSGALRFGVADVIQRVVGAERSTVLSLPMDVENQSRKDLLLQSLDIWVALPDGTVLSQPQLSQDGVSVWRAEVNAREHAQLVATFRLDSAGAFDAFELHWGGLLAYEPRKGVVRYAAQPGEGYPGYLATTVPGDDTIPDMTEELHQNPAYAEEFYPEDEFYVEEDPGYWVYDDPYYWGGSYFSVSVGFGYPWYGWWGWPCYGWGYPYYAWGWGWGGYYPAYPAYPCYDCGYYGSSGRQVKEDAVLRNAGRAPVDGGGGDRNAERLGTAGRYQDRGAALTATAAAERAGRAGSDVYRIDGSSARGRATGGVYRTDASSASRRPTAATGGTARSSSSTARSYGTSRTARSGSSVRRPTTSTRSGSSVRRPAGSPRTSSSARGSSSSRGSTVRRSSTTRSTRGSYSSRTGGSRSTARSSTRSSGGSTRSSRGSVNRGSSSRTSSRSSMGRSRSSSGRSSMGRSGGRSSGGRSMGGSRGGGSRGGGSRGGGRSSGRGR